MITEQSASQAATTKKGRIIGRLLSKSGQDPFESCKWIERDVQINDSSGKALYAQKSVAAPEFWTLTALNIVASKYFAGEGSQRERSVRQLIERVVKTITQWGSEQGYFSSDTDRQSFHDELSFALLHQYCAFNSPVWFNVGVRPRPQCSACFILSVEDTLESLLELQTTEAKLFKYGSGTGTNLSSIRSSKERLSGGGVPSGPVSFMRGFDAWANIIKSGGKTRRAAKMQILNADHPDVMEFIEIKRKEEDRARLLQSLSESEEGIPLGAYENASLQNCNTSVRAGDEFMRAVVDGTPFHTRRVTDGAPCEELNARDLLRAIASSTHACGDPGMQFDTTINAWHTCPNSGRINASNPCSEYMHLDNSACNLASINLLKFLGSDSSFDDETFRHVVDLLITAQDIVIERSSYPTPRIGECAARFRQLGLGYTNLGALLMAKGLPYDSDAGRSWAAAITSTMSAQAYLTSTVLAEACAPFDGFSENRTPMLKVIGKHREAAEQDGATGEAAVLLEDSLRIWDEALQRGATHGVRNAQVTVLAPTGTISFMMDCDTTGIEPDIGLVKYKRLAGGGTLKMVNSSVARGLKTLGYANETIKEIIAHVEQSGTVEGCPALRPEHLEVFDCALKPANGSRHVHYLGHLKMMAAVQPYLSGAISKTVNLPHEATVDEIMDVYLTAWRLGLKSVALYRDGSKSYQPLVLQKKGKAAATSAAAPVRRRLPNERRAITHKFSVGGLEGYLTVGLYDDGSPGEIFMVVAKEGSTLSGVMDAFATAVSLALQYGVPLQALTKKFAHLRFEPSGLTGNPDIPMAKSIIDYVFRWMELKFLQAGQVGKATANGNGVSNGTHHTAPAAVADANGPTYEDAPPCTSCGSGLMVRQGNCYVCLNCGTQGGCG